MFVLHKKHLGKWARVGFTCCFKKGERNTFSTFFTCNSRVEAAGDWQSRACQDCKRLVKEYAARTKSTGSHLSQAFSQFDGGSQHFLWMERFRIQRRSKKRGLVESGCLRGLWRASALLGGRQGTTVWLREWLCWGTSFDKSAGSSSFVLSSFDGVCNVSLESWPLDGCFVDRLCVDFSWQLCFQWTSLWVWHLPLVRIIHV